MTKKVLICLTGLFIIAACTACKTEPAYVFGEFLNALAIRSGIGQSDIAENNLNDLSLWGVTVIQDELEKPFDYSRLSKTVAELLKEDDDIASLKRKQIIDDDVKDKQTVLQKEGEEIITRTVAYLNNRNFEPVFDYRYRSEPKNEEDILEKGDIVETAEGFKKVVDDEETLEQARFEEVFDYFQIADSFYIDFEEAEVIPYGEEENSAYVNEKFNLLASNNHVFNTEGFRVSYTLNKAGIDIHLSKEINGVNVYGDLSLNNVKPVFKWLYEEDDVKNCFFSVSFKTTEKIGASIGRYGNYHLKFKDVDSSSFKSLIGSVIEKDKDEIEASIPICQIKTPIPNMPSVFLNLDLLIKVYVSGKIELVLYNSHNIGFETRDGNVRFINDSKRDLDAIIQASGKAALGLNINLEAVKFRLADIELDGGVRALVKSTLHLYDKDGEVKSEKSDYALSTLMELSDGNPDVKVCGDLSLYYLLDLIINTSKTQMARFGFTKTYNIMDEDNQIFNNLSHIEDGHFVKSCTRNKRPNIVSMDEVKSTRIVLNSYAEVISKDETFMIEILGLPEGYTNDDLIYTSLDSSIATVKNGLIRPVSPGSTRIEIYTSDKKYTAYVNVLVSTQ